MPTVISWDRACYQQRQLVSGMWLRWGIPCLNALDTTASRTSSKDFQSNWTWFHSTGIFASMAKPTAYTGFIDKIGMTASGICSIHCLLLPLVFVLFPYASVAFIKGEMFEWGFILFSLTIACFAMMQGFLVHKKWIPLALALVGFGTFIGVRLSRPNSHETFSGSLIFVLAGVLICTAHYLNHKFIKKHRCICSH